MVGPWTRVAATGGLAALTATSCTLLWGIDDLSYDLVATGGSSATALAGAGGSGGSSTSGGGSGAGAAPPSCHDVLDVPVKSIDVAVAAPVAIAAAGQVVGSVWVHDPASSAIRVVFSDRDGNHINDDDAGAVGNADHFRPAIAAGSDRFAVVVPKSTDNLLEVRLFDPDKLAASTLEPTEIVLVPPPDAESDPPAGQADVVALGAGFLVTAGAPDVVYHALVDGPAYPALAQSSPDGSVCCCAARRWASVGGATAQLAWQATCDATVWQVRSFDAAGEPTGTGELHDLAGAPSFALRLGADLILASCAELVWLTEQGTERGRIALPGGACAIASTGDELRWARNEAGVLRWRALDPQSGVGDELLAVAPGNDEVPAVAWDGSGFVLMWPLAGKIGYARIGCG